MKSPVFFIGFLSVLIFFSSVNSDLCKSEDSSGVCIECQDSNYNPKTNCTKQYPTYSSINVTALVLVFILFPLSLCIFGVPIIVFVIIYCYYQRKKEMDDEEGSSKKQKEVEIFERTAEEISEPKYLKEEKVKDISNNDNQIEVDFKKEFSSSSSSDYDEDECIDEIKSKKKKKRRKLNGKKEKTGNKKKDSKSFMDFIGCKSSNLSATEFLNEIQEEIEIENIKKEKIEEKKPKPKPKKKEKVKVVQFPEHFKLVDEDEISKPTERKNRFERGVNDNFSNVARFNERYKPTEYLEGDVHYIDESSFIDRINNNEQNLVVDNNGNIIDANEVRNDFNNKKRIKKEIITKDRKYPTKFEEVFVDVKKVTSLNVESKNEDIQSSSQNGNFEILKKEPDKIAFKENSESLESFIDISNESSDEMNVSDEELEGQRKEDEIYFTDSDEDVEKRVEMPKFIPMKKKEDIQEKDKSEKLNQKRISEDIEKLMKKTVLQEIGKKNVKKSGKKRKVINFELLDRKMSELKEMITEEKFGFDGDETSSTDTDESEIDNYFDDLDNDDDSVKKAFKSFVKRVEKEVEVENNELNFNCSDDEYD